MVVLMAVRQPTLGKLPRTSPLGSYIYVVHFNVGVIKIGFTRTPGERISRYRSSLSPFGITIADLWFSAPHGHAEDNERLLLSFCRARAEQAHGGEYFTGIGYGQVVAFADTLPYVPLQVAPGASVRPSQAKPKSEQIADILRARITSGELPPGALVSEGQLGIEFGVARTTVRRSTAALRDEGLIITRAAMGSFVVDHSGSHEGPVGSYWQLVETLKARIGRGDWLDGRPIASETRLVQEYGIARTTVRRALDVLVEEQVVWKVQGRGTYVGQPPVEG